MRDILNQFKNGEISLSDAEAKLSAIGMVEMDFAKIDTGRKARVGFPEVVFCEGKATEHIIKIAEEMVRMGNKNILLTRASQSVYEALKEKIPTAEYFDLASIILLEKDKTAASDFKGTIAVVTAGTADIPVAEEAAVTAEAFGGTVLRIYDVGVAGIHRLFARLDEIRSARVVICVAGMEGALASVVGGLVDKPVIAVPTSIGYGASFGGLAPLLTMLNSCAAGVATVNIDNGFGAAYMASLINKL